MTTKSDYETYTLFQLRCALRKRHLPISGSKEELVTRLMDDDPPFPSRPIPSRPIPSRLFPSRPFPFLKLPGEIRNKIYKYVVTFQKPVNRRAINSAVDSRELPHHVCAGDIQNQASIAQPDLFHTCSQIYQESRPLFYRCREFNLHIWQDPGKKQHSRCLKKVLDWLDTIGTDTQKQIRTLEIDLQCDKSTDMYTYTWFADNLHANLSEKATVIYRPISKRRARHDVSFLWGIGKILHAWDRRRVPQFEHPNWSIRDSHTPGNDVELWACFRNPLVYTPKKLDVDRPSLKFGPDKGWFGKEAGVGSI